MAGASRSTGTAAVEVSVHNEGPSAVDVRAIVHGDGVVDHGLSLAPGETATLPAPTGAPIEVYAPSGSATALAGDGPLFVVRDGSVLVAVG
jgi:hypothetical protein